MRRRVPTARSSARSRGHSDTPALDGPLDLLRARAVELLDADAPLSSSGLASALLGVASGSEAACRRLIEPILASDHRFHADEAGMWRLSEAVSVYTPRAALGDGAWVVWVYDRAGHTLAGVRLEGGTRAGFEAVSTRALAPRTIARLAQLGARAHWMTTASFSPRPRARARAGSHPVREKDLLAILHRHRPHESAFERATLDLGRLAAFALEPPSPRSLASLADRLDLPARAMDDSLDRALQAGECLLALLDQPGVRTRSLSQLIDALNQRLPRPRPPIDLAGREFDAAFLRALPEEPGAYRFFDRGRRLLYVGKAKNLRRRVGSYFSPRSIPDSRTASWLEDVHRIEIETTGSELQALLREADLIARKKPIANVQIEVHTRGFAERGGRGDLVLLLPDRAPGVTRVYLIREASLAGRLALGPRGRGMAALRARIEALYFDASSPSNLRHASKGQERDRSILASWLARHPEGLSAFDPTEATTAAVAAQLAFRYARSLQAGETGVIHRQGHRPSP